MFAFIITTIARITKMFNWFAPFIIHRYLISFNHDILYCFTHLPATCIIIIKGRPCNKVLLLLPHPLPTSQELIEFWIRHCSSSRVLWRPFSHAPWDVLTLTEIKYYVTYTFVCNLIVLSLYIIGLSVRD